MTQYINKTALVAEIEKLRKSNKPKENKDYAQFELDVSCGYDMALDDIKTFIVSLQEEPVRKTSTDIESAMQEVEEKSKAFTEAHKNESSDKIIAQMRGEEHVSEDLEKAAKRYATEGDEISGLYIIDEEVEAFKAGAKWYKEHGEFTR